MQFTLFDLRIFGHAIRELVTTGKSDYKKITDPNKSSNTNNNGGGLKELTLNKKNETYFINIAHKQNSIDIGCGFDKREIIAMIDSVKNFCNICDSKLLTRSLDIFQKK